MKLNTHKIKLEMARKPLTSKALSESAGISQQFFSRMMVKGYASPISAGKIATGLGVDVSEIVKEE